VAEELTLRTPPEFASTLGWLADLEDEGVEGGLSVLRSTVYDRRVVVEQLGEQPGWSRESADGVLSLLVSISDVQGLLGAPPDVVARAIASTLDREAEAKTALVDRLGRYLSSRVVEFIARGRDLAGEREHVLDDARILTDIRPLFTRGADDHLDGAIITHALRLRYTGSAEPALHIALDKAHLLDLAEEVQRALRKAAHLEEILSELRLPYVEPSAPHSELPGAGK
jgi:hypothetical protein